MTTPTRADGIEITVRLSPAAAQQIQDLVGLGLAASPQHYVADAVRNRLAGYQEINGIRQPDGDPTNWVTPAPRAH
jgi:hypothetical protein